MGCICPKAKNSSGKWRRERERIPWNGKLAGRWCVVHRLSKRFEVLWTNFAQTSSFLLACSKNLLLPCCFALQGSRRPVWILPLHRRPAICPTSWATATGGGPLEHGKCNAPHTHTHTTASPHRGDDRQQQIGGNGSKKQPKQQVIYAKQDTRRKPGRIYDSLGQMYRDRFVVDRGQRGASQVKKNLTVERDRKRGGCVLALTFPWILCVVRLCVATV